MIDPKELERLSKAATPGPWRHDTYGNIYQEDKLVAECDGTELDSMDVHDAELIVYLRNNVDMILAALGMIGAVMDGRSISIATAVCEIPSDEST